MAPRLSVMCAGSAVPGMTAVTRSVAEEILEKELRPAAGERLCPIGKFLAVHGAKQPAAAERKCGEHAAFHLGGERQDALFRFAVIDRIIDLHEIRFLTPQNRFNGGKIPVPGRGDADVTANALLLPFPELRQRLLRIAHVVELQQVEPLRLQSGLRAFQLRGVGRFKLGGDEQLVAERRDRDHLAQHGLGIAIGRRGIDQASAAGDQGLDDSGRFLPGGLVVSIEYVGGTEPHRRQPLAAAWNGPGHELAGLCRCRRGEHRRPGERGKFAAGHGDVHLSFPWRRRPLISAARCSCARPSVADRTSQAAATGQATSAIAPSFRPSVCKLSKTHPYNASEPR